MTKRPSSEAAPDSEVWSRPEIESPCVKICVVHPGAGVCVGCFRTPAEIAAWSQYSAEERATIMAELPARDKKLQDPAFAASARTGRRNRRDRKKPEPLA